MGFLSWFRRKKDDAIFPARMDVPPLVADRGRRSVSALAKWVGMTEGELRAIPITYKRFAIPKRSGGKRWLHSPGPELKEVQRRLLRRVLAKLKAHPAATGYERGHSIVTNAKHHEKRAVVVRIDLVNFFGTTRMEAVHAYFLKIGWSREAADLLTRLCTHDGGLPQGAPTSPRLSNLVNWELDAKLQGLADKRGARYSRYADDLTFSFETDDREVIHGFVGAVGVIVGQCGYDMHMKKKLHIRRRHQRQDVTGLVVNDGARLPRETRRWLRAVEHRARTGGRVTLTPTELAGWRAFARMVEGADGTDRAEEESRAG